MQIDVAPDPQGAADIAASWIARRLRDAVRRRGQATIAFSGGTTPIPMLHTLAMLDVPWNLVRAYQVDERVAPDGSTDRNVSQLAALPLPVRNIRAMPVTASLLPAAARRYARGMPERFDIVHLGAGDDGHTASWPPDDPVVEASEAVAVVGPFNGRVRMTLTPPVVNAARARLVLVVGADKAPIVRRWLDGDRTLPVSRIRRTGTWVVLDAAAAAALPQLPGRTTSR